MSALLPLLVALLRAIPALESLVKSALETLERGREVSALMRRNAKDAAVDAALAAPPKDGGNGGLS